MNTTGGKCAVALALCLAAAGAVQAAAPAKKAPVKISAGQLYTRLDMLDKKLDDLAKAVAGGLPSPRVTVPSAGGTAEARSLTEAFYNYGVYQRRAANTRLAAQLIRDITVLSGSVIAVVGWEDARTKVRPAKTLDHAFHYYKGFSYGVSTVIVGLIVSEFVEMAANRAEEDAARSLMHPLESDGGAPVGASTSSAAPGGPAKP